MTYTPIASITLGSSASSVTFSSIPQDYRDLVLVINGKIDNSQDLRFVFNSDTSNIYSRVFMFAQSGSSGSASNSNESAGRFASVQTVDNLVIANIMDYSATDKHKLALVRSNNAGNRVRAYAGRYGSTSAITSIQLDPLISNWQTGTTLALYGIEA